MTPEQQAGALQLNEDDVKTMTFRTMREYLQHQQGKQT